MVNVGDLVKVSFKVGGMKGVNSRVWVQIMFLT